MFNIKNVQDFRKIWERHRSNVAIQNIYFQHIRLLNTYKNTMLISYEEYKENFESIVYEIEMETSPIDVFVPCTDKDDCEKLFTINQLVPEYTRLALLINADTIKEILPVTHPANVYLSEHPDNVSKLIDDIFVSFSMTKYLLQIDLIQLESCTDSAKLVEYIVENITLKDMKNYLTSKKIKVEHYEKYCSDIMFNPQVASLVKFYNEEHGDIPAFDIVNLMMRLASNVVCKSDIYIILGIYMILTIAQPDIKANKESCLTPCVDYIRDVLLKI